MKVLAGGDMLDLRVSCASSVAVRWRPVGNERSNDLRASVPCSQRDSGRDSLGSKNYPDVIWEGSKGRDRCPV